MNPVVNSDMTPINPKSFEMLTYLSVTYRLSDSGSLLQSPARRSISLHKRQVNPRDTFAEAVEFCHRHSELVRPIL